MKARKVVKIIDAIVVLSCVITPLAIIGGEFLKHKKSYDEYYAKAYDPSLFCMPVSLSASLKENAHFYANGLAQPKASDFEIKCVFTSPDEKGTFETILDPSKHKIAVDYNPNFYKDGGDVKITFKNKVSTTVSCELEDIYAESLNIIEYPFKVTYKENSQFDSEGMVIKLVYNDGSSRILTDNEYNIVSTNITKGTEEILISFIDFNKTIFTKLPINVVDTINDTTFKSIKLRGEGYCAPNTKLSNAVVEVVGIYESGNSRILLPQEYSIKNGNENVLFGKEQFIKINLNENSKITLNEQITVRNHFEGEDIVSSEGGGQPISEEEYIESLSGDPVATGKILSFAGKFPASGTGFIEFPFNSVIETKGDLTFRCGNSYLIRENSGPYFMSPLQVNTVADLIVIDEDGNSVTTVIPDNVVLKGCGPSNDYAPLYNIYHEFTVKDVNIPKGYSTFRFQFKPSTDGVKNYWNEDPSTMNIDYINLDCKGSEIQHFNNKIVDIDFAPEAAFKYGQLAREVSLPMIATDTKGKTFPIDPALIIFEVNGETGRLFNESYEIHAKLASNDIIATTKTISCKNKLKIEAEKFTRTGDDVFDVTKINEYVDTNPTGNRINVIKGIGESLNANKETSFEINVHSDKTESRKLWARVANTNLYSSLTESKAIAMDMAKVLKLSVNDENVKYSAIIPQVSNSVIDDSLKYSFVNVCLGNIDLIKGNNKISFSGIKSGPKNMNNIVSAPIIDYFVID